MSLRRLRIWGNRMSDGFNTAKTEDKQDIVRQRGLRHERQTGRRPFILQLGVHREVPTIFKKLSPIHINHQFMNEEPVHICSFQKLAVVRVGQPVQLIERFAMQRAQLSPRQTALRKMVSKCQPLAEPSHRYRVEKLRGAVLQTAPLSLRVSLRELHREETPSLSPKAKEFFIKELPELEEEPEVQAQPQLEKTPSGPNLTAALPTFYELFLEGDSLGHAFSAGEPRVIILGNREDEEVKTTVTRLCQYTYREQEGEKPLIAISSEEELRRMRAQNTVTLVDDSEGKLMPSFRKDDAKWNDLRDRIWEFSTEGRSGFLIFSVPNEEGRMLCKDLREEFEEYLNLFFLGPKSLSEEEKASIASLAWGLGELASTPPIFEVLAKGTGVRPRTIDSYFSDAKEKYNTEMSSLPGSIYVTATHRDPNEGNDHFLLKAYTVRYYAQLLELDEDKPDEIRHKVKTEVPADGGIADIHLDEEYVEIETLYGEVKGAGPLKKIDEDIEKRSGHPLTIVLPSLTLLRHLSGLRIKLEHNKGQQITILMPKLKNKGFIAIDEVEREVRRLAKL